MMKKNVCILSVILAVCSCIEKPVFSEELINAGTPVFESKVPQVIAKSASSIEVETSIEKENGARITERGFCYGTTSEPTLENSTKITDAETGIGSYTSLIQDNIKNNTTYYIRPYAINSTGTGYGQEREVSTNTGLGVVETITPDNIFAAKANIKGQITDAGEGEIIERGFYISLRKDFLIIDTTLISFVEADEYNSLLTGLKPFTKYYVKAYVTNTFGVFTGGVDSLITRDGLPLVGAISIKDLGYTNVTLTSSASNNSDETVEIIERGFYCWSSIPSDTIIKCGTGTGAFEKIISNLVAQREYFARPYVISNLRSTDTIFGNPVSFYTKTDVPTVSTEPVTNIQNGSAIVKGLVVNQGMTTVTASGICWSTTNPSPLLSDQVLPLALDASNAFTGYLNGLSGGTTYYVRAFATNSEGTAYGNTEQFTTPSVFTLLASFPGATRRPNSTAYTMTTNGSTLFLLCGDLGANYTDELWAYSVSANLWEQRKPFKGSVKGAKWQTAIGYGNGFYVYGGVDFDDTGISDLYYYNATDNDWEVKTNISGDTLRIDTMYNSVGFNYSNGFYLFGGKNYAATDTVKNDAWKFYHDAREWHKLNEFPVKQYGGVAAYIDGIAYVGMGKDDANICNSRIWAGIDQLNDTIDWTLKTTCTIYTGGILTGVASNAAHSIYMIDEDFYILEYNTITNVWRKKSRLPEHTGIYCMYEIGGSIYIGTYRNAFYKYEPSWDN